MMMKGKALIFKCLLWDNHILWKRISIAIPISMIKWSNLKKIHQFWYYWRYKVSTLLWFNLSFKKLYATHSIYFILLKLDAPHQWVFGLVGEPLYSQYMITKIQVSIKILWNLKIWALNLTFKSLYWVGLIMLIKFKNSNVEVKKKVIWYLKSN